MREICLALILANLGFLAWSRWIAMPAAPSGVEEAYTTVPRLKLVDEMADSGAEPDPEPVAVQTQREVAAQGSIRCVSLGPFIDLPEAVEAAAALREKGLVPSQRIAESEVWVGHWVHLPPYSSRDEAQSVVTELRAQGVTDMYIEPSGELENAVSLGLFSDRVRAETRAGSLRRFGHSPQIRDRNRLAAVYWVDFELDSSTDVKPGDFPMRAGRIVRLEGRVCPGTDSPPHEDPDSGPAETLDNSADMGAPPAQDGRNAVRP